jgi:hypothetical protein
MGLSAGAFAAVAAKEGAAVTRGGEAGLQPASKTPASIKSATRIVIGILSGERTGERASI